EVEPAAERLGARSRGAPCPGCAQGGGRRARGGEVGAAVRRTRTRPGRGGHGGRCCVHGRSRCLRVPGATRPYPGRSPGHPWEGPRGCRVVVAHSYSPPDAPWHIIWRTLANPGE